MKNENTDITITKYFTKDRLNKIFNEIEEELINIEKLEEKIEDILSIFDNKNNVNKRIIELDTKKGEMINPKIYELENFLNELEETIYEVKQFETIRNAFLLDIESKFTEEQKKDNSEEYYNFKGLVYNLNTKEELYNFFLNLETENFSFELKV